MTAQSTKIVTVTPKMAAAWIKRQELLELQDETMRNRHPKEGKIRMYARDMAAGRWSLNGETLIFAENGRIMDGRHRLLACVEADKPFRTHVVDNVPHDAMKTIDTGIIRSMGDQLTIEGKIGGNHLGAALGVLWRWDQTNHRGFDWSARPTRLEQWETLDKHPDIEKFVSRSGRLKSMMSAGLGGALWYIFAKQDETLAEVFFEALISGTNMQQDDPVFVLRERLLRERRELAIRRVKANLSMDATTELVHRAWDATRRGVKIQKLQRASKPVDKDVLMRRVKGKNGKVQPLIKAAGGGE